GQPAGGADPVRAEGLPSDTAEGREAGAPEGEREGGRQRDPIGGAPEACSEAWREGGAGCRGAGRIGGGRGAPEAQEELELAVVRQARRCVQALRRAPDQGGPADQGRVSSAGQGVPADLREREEAEEDVPEVGEEPRRG